MLSESKCTKTFQTANPAFHPDFSTVEPFQILELTGIR